MFDRWGAKTIRPAAVTYVASFMLTSLSDKYWQLMLAQGLLGGIALGMTMCPSMAATPQYFNKKRGAAMGLMIAGSSIGGVVWPIALSKLLANESLGFGWSLRIVGFINLAVLAYATLGIKARLPSRKSGFLLLSAFRDPVYCLIITSCFFLFLGLFTPLFFLPLYAQTKGMDPLLAGYLLAILNGASLPGRILPGILADKFGRLNMLFASAVASGIITLCWTKCETNAGIIVFAVVFGFCSGAIVSAASVSLASCPEDPKDNGVTWRVPGDHLWIIIFIPRCIGGCGCTTPSNGNVAKQSLELGDTIWSSLHGIGATSGSLSHGSVESIACIMNPSDGRPVIMTPIAEDMTVCPNI
ncbi:major facilitator superfamily domain-containing protein [Cercophora newfieldiana]|uniref:Major facilitator superfamily domain-containing protein n=1 Tax=Cercophora newfieldiana TaxID=92897 RepID=A0AA39XSK4_9PEZI|nr:major facilitator superfamily domain-containing protein [Cercophora newfieldiana]